MHQYSSTEEAMAALKEAKAEQQRNFENSQNPRSWRFYMKKGTETKIVFLDDLLFPIKEHRFQAGGSFNNFETCLQDIEGDCPLCDNSNKPYFAMASTIIDFTPFTRKDGTEVQASKRLIVVKSGGAEKLLRRQKEHGTLIGKVFKMYRSHDQKGEATGTDLELLKDADMEKLKQFAPKDIDPEEWIKPYDYEKLFAPKSPEELRQAIGVAPPVGSEDAPQPQQQQEQPPAEKKALADLI